MSDEVREVRNPAESDIVLSVGVLPEASALDAEDLENTRLFHERDLVELLGILLGDVCPYDGFVLLKPLPLVDRGAVDHGLGSPVTWKADAFVFFDGETIEVRCGDSTYRVLKSLTYSCSASVS